MELPKTLKTEHPTTTMTIEDISKKLHEDFTDEIHDANKYMDMAENAKRLGHDDTAYYLLEIAKDEYSHACYIYMYLNENNIPIDKEDSEDWNKLMVRFRGWDH